MNPPGTSPAARSHSASVVVAADPDTVYALVSDVTRTGEWSPVVTTCWWDSPVGARGPQPGDGFTGRNQTPARTWETHCTVVEALPGRRFSWLVSDAYVRWSYDLEPLDGGTRSPSGTRLTETWEFLEAGMARFHELYGDRAAEQIDDRTRAAHEGIPASLAAISQLAAG